MRIDRRALVKLGIAGAAGSVLSAAKAMADVTRSTRFPLWPDRPPDPIPTGVREHFVERSTDTTILDRALHGVTHPFIEVWRPETKVGNGASVLIMPGGGYRHMAWDKEGLDVARWFAARGITGIVLGYRLPNDGWASGVNAPLADAQRAMRLIRSNAANWDLDADRIAALGFSAGGHLCANLAARFAKSAYAAVDAVDGLSARPALAAPIYPAIKLDEIGGPLLGPATTADLLAAHSPHRNIPDNAPPHFLVHAEDDPLVGPEHSLALRAALVAKKKVVETHLFARGGHGFGIRLTRGLPVADWPERLLAFGRATGWASA